MLITAILDNCLHSYTLGSTQYDRLLQQQPSSLL